MEEIITDVSIVIHEVLPRLLSQHVAADVGFALVDKYGLLVECAVVSPNDNFILKLHYELLASVYFEADVHSTLLYKDNFLNFIEFLEHDSLSFNEYWLELCEDVHDKISIILIFPGNEPTIRANAEPMCLHFFDGLGCWDQEGFSECIHELFE